LGYTAKIFIDGCHLRLQMVDTFAYSIGRRNSIEFVQWAN